MKYSVGLGQGWWGWSGGFPRGLYEPYILLHTAVFSLSHQPLSSFPTAPSVFFHFSFSLPSPLAAPPWSYPLLSLSLSGFILSFFSSCSSLFVSLPFYLILFLLFLQLTSASSSISFNAFLLFLSSSAYSPSHPSDPRSLFLPFLHAHHASYPINPTALLSHSTLLICIPSVSPHLLPSQTLALPPNHPILALHIYSSYETISMHFPIHLCYFSHTTPFHH